jgi:hypothetical protein
VFGGQLLIQGLPMDNVSQPPAMRSFSKILSLAALSTVAMMCGCGSPMFNTTAKSAAISVSPSDTTAWAGDVRQMKAIVANSDAAAVIWSTTSGTLSPTGLLSIPATIGDTVVTVTATSAIDQRRTANAYISVRHRASHLTATPTSETLSATQGSGNPSSFSLRVAKSGSIATFNFTATSDQPWLALSNSTGIGPASIEALPSIAGLAPGKYTGHITFSAPGIAAVTVAVSLSVVAAAQAPPAGPTGPATPVQHQAELSWAASSSKNVVGYNVYRSTVPGGPYELAASAVGGLTYTDQTVQPSVIYYYVATATNDGGAESVYSAQVKVVVP